LSIWQWMNSRFNRKISIVHGILPLWRFFRRE